MRERIGKLHICQKLVHRVHKILSKLTVKKQNKTTHQKEQQQQK